MGSTRRSFLTTGLAGLSGLVLGKNLYEGENSSVRIARADKDANKRGRDVASEEIKVAKIKAGIKLNSKGEVITADKVNKVKTANAQRDEIDRSINDSEVEIVKTEAELRALREQQRTIERYAAMGGLGLSGLAAISGGQSSRDHKVDIPPNELDIDPQSLDIPPNEISVVDRDPGTTNLDLVEEKLFEQVDRNTARSVSDAFWYIKRAKETASLYLEQCSKDDLTYMRILDRLLPLLKAKGIENIPEQIFLENLSSADRDSLRECWKDFQANPESTNVEAVWKAIETTVINQSKDLLAGRMAEAILGDTNDRLLNNKIYDRMVSEGRPYLDLFKDSENTEQSLLDLYNHCVGFLFRHNVIPHSIEITDLKEIEAQTISLGKYRNFVHASGASELANSSAEFWDSLAQLINAKNYAKIQDLTTTRNSLFGDRVDITSTVESALFGAFSRNPKSYLVSFADNQNGLLNCYNDIASFLKTKLHEIKAPKGIVLADLSKDEYKILLGSWQKFHLNPDSSAVLNEFRDNLVTAMQKNPVKKQ